MGIYEACGMKKTLYELMFRLGIVRLCQYFQRKQVLILMVHGVMDREDEASEWDPLWERHSPKQLDFVLSTLAQRYTFVSMDDAVAMLNGHQPITSNAVVVTFDDGYRNNITHALPVMHKHHAPMLIYLATSAMSKQEAFWIDRIDYALQKLGDTGGSIAVGGLEIELNSSDRKAASVLYKKFRLQAKKVARSDYEFLQEMDKIGAQLEAKTGHQLADIFARDPWSGMLTWPEVEAQVVTEGLCFGSHTVDHLRLALISEDDVRDQLIGAKSIIEGHTKEPCNHFCYPAGSYNGDVAAIVRDVGYASATTTVPGLNDVGCDMMTLKRYNLPVSTNEAEVLAEFVGLKGIVGFVMSGFKKVLGK